jgi:hypothetical protein
MERFSVGDHVVLKQGLRQRDDHDGAVVRIEAGAVPSAVGRPRSAVRTYQVLAPVAGARVGSSTRVYAEIDELVQAFEARLVVLLALEGSSRAASRPRGSTSESP